MSSCGATNAKQIVAAFFRVKRPERPVFPIVVTITRLGPRALDSDNLASSGKHVRDAIATWLGVDDGVAERTLIEGVQQGGHRLGRKGRQPRAGLPRRAQR